MYRMYIWHSSCKQFHAKREYKCAITGKKISIGELYCRLIIIEENRKKHNWTIKLDAFEDYKQFKRDFYVSPELAIQKYDLNTSGYSLGFFN